uniref:Probable U3 small nucleolar RNA-associated protein 11 n=1 Tax=Romanomermis culicivorax TaxID=13658 RepID=A0A915KEK2_ROMCU
MEARGGRKPFAANVNEIFNTGINHESKPPRHDLYKECLDKLALMIPYLDDNFSFYALTMLVVDIQNWHDYLDKKIRVKTIFGSIFEGFLYTIDPVSKIMCLTNNSDAEKSQNLYFIIGSNVSDMTLIDDVSISNNITKSIDLIFNQNRSHFTHAEIESRRFKVDHWLKANRIPFDIDQNGNFLLLNNILRIKEPYTMASLKNFDKTKQRTHKERSQLFDRQHLGQLEKKKDYKLRASQNEKKRETLKFLNQKALERNPDEFYFHMIKSKTKNGIHFDKLEDQDEEANENQQKLIRTQNLRYVSHKLNVEHKKIEKLLTGLHMSNHAIKVNKRTVFPDDDGAPRSSERSIPSKKVRVDIQNSNDRSEIIRLITSQDLRQVDEEQKRQYTELMKRIERERELHTVQKKLQTKLLLQLNMIQQSGNSHIKSILPLIHVGVTRNAEELVHVHERGQRAQKTDAGNKE